MAISNTQIANRALQKLGARRIESLSEDSANARSVTTAFEPVRDRLLREFDWNFAIERASVPASATETLWGGLNRFPKPDGFLRLLRQREAGTFELEERKRWQVEGDHIVTSDAAPLEFRFIKQVADPTKFDSLFVELFAVSLAVELIGDIETSANKKQILLQEREDRLREARLANSYENDTREPPEDEWLQERL